MASSTYDGAGAEEQDQERQQQREAKRYRISSSNHTTTSDNSNNSNSSGSGGGDDNSTIASQQSSLSLTFQTPLGLEDRFQKLLTLQETVDDEVDDHDLEVVTQSEVDSLLYAKDMYELSPAEREQVLWDIHGVAAQVVSNDDDDNSVETDEFINEKRQVLQQCLLQSNTHGTHAYSQALCQNASYVQSPHVQLPFLRCHAWNPQEACDKLLAFFTLKLQLFGSAKLCRDIGISDLSSSNKEDRKMLDSGFFQLLPQRDVAGRAILVAMPMCSYDNMSIVSLVSYECGTFYYSHVPSSHFVPSHTHTHNYTHTHTHNYTDASVLLHVHDSRSRRRDATERAHSNGLQRRTASTGQSKNCLARAQGTTSVATQNHGHSLLLRRPAHAPHDDHCHVGVVGVVSGAVSGASWNGPRTASYLDDVRDTRSVFACHQ